jgi:multiple sugar transport system permease protein
MRVNKVLSDWAYIIPVLAVITTIFILPLFFAFWVSLHYKPLGLPPVFIGLENYVNLFNSPILYTTLLNTFVYAFSAVFIKTLIGLGVALLLNKNFRGRGIMRGLAITPWALPAFAVCVMFWFGYDHRGLFNRILKGLGLSPIHWLGFDYAMPSVILVNVWKGWPFFFLGLLAGLQAISTELYEAAEIDGASVFQKFRYITIPSLKPVFLIVCMLSLMWTMGDFTVIYMMTAGGPIDKTLTVPMASYKIAFLSEVNIPLASAYCIVILPVYLGLIYILMKRLR